MDNQEQVLPDMCKREDLSEEVQTVFEAALVEKRAELYNGRSTWLKQRLHAASELLSKAAKLSASLRLLGQRWPAGRLSIGGLDKAMGEPTVIETMMMIVASTLVINRTQSCIIE